MIWCRPRPARSHAARLHSSDGGSASRARRVRPREQGSGYLRTRTLKASTLFGVILLVLIAGSCPGLLPDVRAQAHGAGRARVTPPAAGSTLGGRVVCADTGNPVRRAEVTLISAAAGERFGEAVTNVKGEFSFKD